MPKKRGAYAVSFYANKYVGSFAGNVVAAFQ
jgi:hypothetical protein